MVCAAFTGMTALGVTAVAAPAAFATSGKWIIKSTAGAPIANNTHYSASNSTAATLSTSTNTLNCPVGTAVGEGALLQSGTGKVGTVSVANFGVPNKGCTLGTVADFSDNITSGKGPFSLHATSSKSGVVHGKLTGPNSGSISTTLHGNVIIGGTCTATIGGKSVPISYNNTTHKLTFNPADVKTLTVKTNNCTGITVGQAAGFHATYHIFSPASLSGATITDP
jgi:hypothetical protein